MIFIITTGTSLIMMLFTILTFPGVIMHAIAQRFMCDILNVPVYRINYFSVFSRATGDVFHEDTNNFGVACLISMVPFILNSILCMLLTLPIGIIFILGTKFSLQGTTFDYLKFILCWIGVSCGFNAVPSKQDIKKLSNKPHSYGGKIVLFCIKALFWPFHIPIINLGTSCSLMYVGLLSLLLPVLFFRTMIV